MNRQFDFNELETDLQSKLKRLEAIVGSLHYISGKRTRSYNAGVGGASDSQHIYGRAVDIARNSFKESPVELGKIAVELGFTGIGFYDTHIHLDDRPNPNFRGFSFWDKRTRETQVTASVIKKKTTIPVITVDNTPDIIQEAKKDMGNVTMNDKIPVVLLTGALAVAFITAITD